MGEGVEKCIRTIVELPVDEYIKAVLLVAEGEYANLKQIIRDGLRKVFEKYGEEYFEEVKSRNEELVESIMKNAKIVERTRVRRWVVKK